MRACILLCLGAVLACGADVVDSEAAGGAGGEGGAQEPVKLDDRCESIDPASNGPDKAMGSSCCDAGCAPVQVAPSGLCVDIGRHCLFKEGNEEPWEKPCPPGYECVVGYGTPSSDPCAFGELVNGYHGYCFWMGDDI